MLSILAITPWLFVGFDTIPQTAEEFDFPPEKSRRLMINSIVCGALLYALVLIAVAIIIPYTDLLGQNHSWTTGAVANMAFGRFGGVILAIPGTSETINSLYKTCIMNTTKQIRESLGDRDFCRSVFKDNAGVIAFTPEYDACIKVETHNSPSALDPYGGALTAASR